MRAVAGALPGLPQVASFDTAFHRSLPLAAATLPLPASWRRRFGLRRYGFHGLNVAWCLARAREELGAERTGRLVVCHLGSGCSVTAVRDGRSVDTTMGFTPLDGVPMATRPGSLDPGVLLHLLAHGVGREELEHGLEHESGLLGVSGVSADVREVLAAADRGDDDAQLALEVFVHAVARAVGAMAAALGGSTAWCSPAGSARTPRGSARRSWGISATWEWAPSPTRTRQSSSSPRAKSS